ncbi:MAG TPA: ABC transporter ATP-binding protein [Mycobacteriales bacterium]|nr:ABC transporter ATP-binding protein [Mycobacteriales bacterium]
MRDLLGYARPHARTVILAMVLGLLAAAAGLAQPLVAKRVIDSLASGTGLGRPLAALSLLVVLAALLGVATTVLLGRTAEGIVLEVRAGLAARLIRLRLSELDRSSPGDLIARATADSSLLHAATTTALVDLGTGAVGLVGALVLMGRLDLRLLLISLAVLVVVGVLAGAVLPGLRRALKSEQDAVGILGAALDRALGAARTVKASGAEEREMATMRQAAAEAYAAGLRGVRLQAALVAINGLSVQVPFLAVLGAGGLLVARGDLPVSTLVAFLLYLFYLIGPVARLTGGLTAVQRGLGAVDRIREVRELAVEDDTASAGPGPTAAPPSAAPPAAGLPIAGPAGAPGRSWPWPAGGGPLTVRFDRVSFAYPDRPPVLDGISFTAPAAGLTALVGPSGAGKSTVLALLMRFYDVAAGTICLGGLDVAGLRRGDVRRLIGYVEQDAPALAGTLAENLRYGTDGELSDREVARALAATRLDELVDRLPAGQQTMVGARGVLLSGGERQRLAIARALLRRPRVLLLDEATSQLDARNEQALRDTVQALAVDRTVLVVAHRLSTVTTADRIVVLDAGRVRAIGTHADLVRTDPLYAELAATQLLTPTAR